MCIPIISVISSKKGNHFWSRYFRRVVISRVSLLLAFANTCEILSLPSKGRYFRGVVTLGTLQYITYFIDWKIWLQWICRKLIQVLTIILFSLTFGMQCYIFIYSIKKSTIQGKKAHEENDRARRNVNSINIWRGGNITASIAKFQKLLITRRSSSLWHSMTQNITKNLYFDARRRGWREESKLESLWGRC